jgi:hypothetical protein
MNLAHGQVAGGRGFRLDGPPVEGSRCDKCFLSGRYVASSNRRQRPRMDGWSQTIVDRERLVLSEVEGSRGAATRVTHSGHPAQLGHTV